MHSPHTIRSACNSSHFHKCLVYHIPLSVLNWLGTRNTGHEKKPILVIDKKKLISFQSNFTRNSARKQLFIIILLTQIDDCVCVCVLVSTYYRAICLNPFNYVTWHTHTYTFKIHIICNSSFSRSLCKMNKCKRNHFFFFFYFGSESYH